MKTPEAKYRNLYECPKCGERWEDVWDSMCNDHCPNCDAEIEPYQSITLEEEDQKAPDIWLQQNEEQGMMDCGCRLVADHDGDGPAFFFCDLHRTASTTKIASELMFKAISHFNRMIGEVPRR